MGIPVFRIGYGIDFHKLEKDYPLIIGGVNIPYGKGAVGHSDADVLLHAICDALLGALALGDIGKHFPDTDPAYKGINSLFLLDRCVQLVRAKKYVISNIDSTVCLQKPKLRNFIDQMREKIAEGCHLDIGQVSVKATTTEEMGFVGSGEGIEAHATVLLYSEK